MVMDDEYDDDRDYGRAVIMTGSPHNENDIDDTNEGNRHDFGKKLERMERMQRPAATSGVATDPPPPPCHTHSPASEGESDNKGEGEGEGDDEGEGEGDSEGAVIERDARWARIVIVTMRGWEWWGSGSLEKKKRKGAGKGQDQQQKRHQHQQ